MAPPSRPLPPGYQAYRLGNSAPRSFAGFWIRLAANFLDSLIVGVVPFVLYFVGIATSVGETTTTTTSGQFPNDFTTESYATTSSGPSGVGVALLLLAVVSYLLLLFFLVIRPMGRTGQSIGSRIVGIRVVDSSSGQPIGVARALGRSFLGWILSGWFCNLGYLWMLWDDRNQTWHDKIVSSVVVSA